MRAWCDYCDNGCDLCSGGNPDRSDTSSRDSCGNDYHERRLRDAEICVAMLADLLRNSEDNGPPVTHVRIGVSSLALHDWMPLCDEFEKNGIEELERRRQVKIQNAEAEKRRLEQKRKELAAELQKTEELLRRS